VFVRSLVLALITNGVLMLPVAFVVPFEKLAFAAAFCLLCSLGLAWGSPNRDILLGYRILGTATVGFILFAAMVMAFTGGGPVGERVLIAMLVVNFFFAGIVVMRRLWPWKS